jgi:hypothetical protein
MLLVASLALSNVDSVLITSANFCRVLLFIFSYLAGFRCE